MRNAMFGLLITAVLASGVFLTGCPPCNRCDDPSGSYFSVIYRLSPANRVDGSAVVEATETYHADGTGSSDVLRPDGIYYEDAAFTYDMVECGEFNSERNPVPAATVEAVGLFNPNTDYMARAGHTLAAADKNVFAGFGFRLPTTPPALLGGYVVVDVHSNPQDMVIEAHRHEMAFNSNGTGVLLGATLAENINFSFTVDAGGKLDIAEDVENKNLMDGMVSQGGRTFATIDKETGEDNSIGIQIGFRRATHLCAEAIAGEYHLVVLTDTVAADPSIMRGVLTLDADGSGTVAEAAMSGLGLPAPRAVTYTWDATGEVTLIFTDNGEVSKGIVSEDADAIIFADSTQVAATDTIALMFCVRKP